MAKKMNKDKASSMTCVRSYSKQNFRAAEDDSGSTIVGHPAVFDSMADIGGWFGEIIDRGAFDDCDMTDVYPGCSSSWILCRVSRRYGWHELLFQGEGADVGEP